jgi:hypothetical protein
MPVASFIPMASKSVNSIVRSFSWAALAALASLIVGTPQSQAGLVSSRISADLLPAGTQFILKKKINVQEVSHESDHFGRATACSFWVGKPQSDDFQDEIEKGITFRPQTFVLSHDSRGGSKFALKTAQNKTVTLYCDESAKITTLASLRAALGDTFTIKVPAGDSKARTSVSLR